ncbi:LysR family transcriptional regulator [Streptococcus loxodontisalivarius]|uniref:DNA-binding transcriptional LysR family regulator n=1 Tax=Streptococcus loxodontisalivarius TaxID=1349415 RepID=A0ABS2PSQ0_9STRE|nr:LysR family transcriptional regulator [Streptococcus loxodontisalivarius]MBM7642906.1 DNA-binding transcriptional LysR family regulator [Streptococcus loxodontisalivarius]
MNFQQCRYVETIATTGSFSEAAKTLFVTQPNLSASIRDLEAELGVQLFTRSNTGAKLTDDGHDFLKYAKRILGELDLLEERYRKRFKKSFTIASHHYDFLSLPMAKIAEQYQEDYQEFQIIETTTKRILESVASFESDLGIIYLDEDNRHILERSIKDQELDFTPLGDFQTKIFLGRKHPLAQEKSLKSADLEGYPQVRFRQDKSGINFDEDPLDVLENQRVLYANDRGTVMNLLCASDAYASGLGIVNSFIKDQIVLIPLIDSPIHTLGIVSNKKQKQAAIASSFIQEIKDSLIDHQEKI